MIYFDNAASGHPKPGTVVKCAMRAVRKYGNPGRSGHRLSVEAEKEIYETREKIASYFNAASPERIVFTLNATHALNLAIGVLYRKGDHILLSDLEHNASFRPVHRLSEEGAVSYGFFSHHGNVLDNLEKARTPRTRIIVCTQASNVSGHAMPLREIGRYCADNHLLLIVDGAQGAGHIETDLTEIGCSAYCTSGHKGLQGIQGCGFCAFGTENFERDYVSGGTGSESFLPGMPRLLPDRFEAGTAATPAILSLGEGIRVLQKSKKQIERMHRLTEMMHEVLGGYEGIRLVSDADNKCGIVSLCMEGADHIRLYNALEKRGFCLRSGYHCAPIAHRTLHTEKQGCIRVGLGIFNTEREARLFLSETRQILRTLR